MIPESLWAVIQLSLDERRDPLDDEFVREHLLSHPEDLLELDRLSAPLEMLLAGAPAGSPLPAPQGAAGDLRALGVSRPRAGPATRRPWRRMVAAAVLLALVVFSRLRNEPLGQSRAPEQAAVREERAAETLTGETATAASQRRTRVLSWKITVSTTSVAGTTREVYQPARFVMTHSPARSGLCPPVRSLALAWTDSWIRP